MHVLVHGGAGGTPDEPEPRQATLDRAAETGTDTETPLDAVVEAVRVLESGERFNAGVGGAVQSDGVIRTDAGVMTDDGTTGAAASMAGVEHAVEVARHVATATPHIMLSGESAVALADAIGVETECDLWTDDTRERWADLDPEPLETDDMQAHIEWVHEQFGGIDTVGAVATDGTTLAAATSTGGRWCALAGRVGDVPQVGAGFYTTDHVAVSTTGAGEDIAKFGLARRVAEAVEDGEHPDLATDRLIDAFGEATDAEAGVIAIDDRQRYGEAFNSDGMQTARAE